MLVALANKMTFALSIIAILISLTSLGFAIYQYTQSRHIKVNDKISHLIKEVYNFRMYLEDRNIEYGSTDYAPDFEKMFTDSSRIVDGIVPILEKKNLTAKEFYAIERRFFGLKSTVELTCKKIDEAIRFNMECVDAGYEPIEFDRLE